MNKPIKYKVSYGDLYTVADSGSELDLLLRELLYIRCYPAENLVIEIVQEEPNSMSVTVDNRLRHVL